MKFDIKIEIDQKSKNGAFVQENYQIEADGSATDDPSTTQITVRRGYTDTVFRGEIPVTYLFKAASIFGEVI